jgi:hypothetical protein
MFIIKIYRIDNLYYPKLKVSNGVDRTEVWLHKVKRKGVQEPFTKLLGREDVIIHQMTSICLQEGMLIIKNVLLFFMTDMCCLLPLYNEV